MAIVELPAVYVDDAATEVVAAVEGILYNRIPEPNEAGVPTVIPGGFAPFIEFDLANLVNDTIPTTASFKITIDGVVALINGIVQPGFAGNIIDLTSLGAGAPDTKRVDLRPDTPFGSLQQIDVRVEGTYPSSAVFDETYTFTTEDLTPPVLLAALAISQKIVRVTFDEPVRAQGDGDPEDALAASNYSFRALNDSVTPAVPITPVSVAQVSASEFDVTVDTEMTAGVLYEVTVDNVTDLFGNPI